MVERRGFSRLAVFCVVLGLAVFATTPARAWAQCTDVEDQKVHDAGAAASDFFGQAVALDGAVAVVGAPSPGALEPTRPGNAFVYRWSGGSWQFEQSLIASDHDGSDDFGAAVAVSGDVLAIGSPEFRVKDPSSDPGSVYMFRHDGVQWNEEQRLFAGDGSPDDCFGWSVSLDGDHLVVGAPNAGAAYVFEWTGSTWTEAQELAAGDGVPFGESVALRGNVALIGATGDDHAGDRSGSAYVFRRDNGGTWAQEQKLVASDADTGDAFGDAVAIDGHVAIIGAWADEQAGAIAGSAYVFRNAGGWSQEEKLLAPDADTSDRFGNSVGIDGDVVVVGADRADHGGVFTGAAYTFAFNATNWGPLQKLVASDAAEFDFFGRSVAIHEDRVLVGAYQDDGSLSDTGSAYFYDVPTLAHSVTPSSVMAGDTLTAAGCGGKPGGGLLWAAVAVDQTPIFAGIAVSMFDASGTWTLNVVVPGGLSGLQVQFQIFGRAPTGFIAATETVDVCFQ